MYERASGGFRNIKAPNNPLKAGIYCWRWFGNSHLLCSPIPWILVEQLSPCPSCTLSVYKAATAETREAAWVEVLGMCASGVRGLPFLAVSCDCPGLRGAWSHTLSLVLRGRTAIWLRKWSCKGLGLLVFALGDLLGSVDQHCSWKGWKTCLATWNYLLTMLVNAFYFLLQG